ncbi:MAG TPA: HD domain-containing phosphohydrolase [Patescibacteria group bacterium]|nr:HD domain-containing phosphohydrolase [Patescibacteria group bacterium]
MLTGLISSHELYYHAHHGQTVAVMVRALAAKMELTEERIKPLVVAALLHDIGKIGLPPQCLTTHPDLLDAEDYEMYKSHVKRGVDHILAIRDFEREAEIILQHHERFDGSGFPLGLSGSDITIEAQILQICDLYHNLVYGLYPDELEAKAQGQKPYLAEMELAKRQADAIALIHRRASWFYPEVIKVFYKLAQSGKCAPLQVGIAGVEDEEKFTQKTANDQEKHEHLPDEESLKGIKSIFIPEIRIGMQSAQDIYTFSSKLVLQKGMIIDQSKLVTLKNYFQQNLLPTHIACYKQ